MDGTDVCFAPGAEPGRGAAATRTTSRARPSSRSTASCSRRRRRASRPRPARSPGRRRRSARTATRALEDWGFSGADIEALETAGATLITSLHPWRAVLSNELIRSSSVQRALVERRVDHRPRFPVPRYGGVDQDEGKIILAARRSPSGAPHSSRFLREAFRNVTDQDVERSISTTSSSNPRPRAAKCGTSMRAIGSSASSRRIDSDAARLHSARRSFRVGTGQRCPRASSTISVQRHRRAHSSWRSE